MNPSRTTRLFVLIVTFSILIILFSIDAFAQDTFQTGDTTKQGSGVSLDSAERKATEEPPLPDEKELAGEEQFSLSATTSVTVTLGAWRNLRPTESYLFGISMLPNAYEIDCSSPDQKSKGWIVGEDGLILSFCNGVWDHAIVPESVPTDLWGVQAISPTLGVAVGAQGTVLMYSYDTIAMDYVWTKSPIPVGNQTLFAVSMVADGSGGYTGWAIGNSDASGRGTLVKGTITPVAGSDPLTYNYTWENVTANYPSLPQVDFYYGLQMLSPNNGWASGGKDGEKGVILHWDGEVWSVFQEVGENRLHDLYMLSDNNGWVVGRGGVIYHFNGSSWLSASSPSTENLVDTGFTGSGEGWAVGMNGTLLRYSDGYWSLFTDLRTDPFDFRAIDFMSGHGWMVGYNDEKSIGGQILEYEDGLWLAVTPPTDNQLYDLSIISDNDAWAVGMAGDINGTLIHWDGQHWQLWSQSNPPIPKVNLYAIDMVSSDDGWAAGDPLVSGGPAVFLQWDGYRWAPPRYEAPLNVRVNDLVMLDSDFGWAIADAGNAVARYDGQSGYWSALSTCQGVYYQLRSASLITATNVFDWDAWAVGNSTNPGTGEYFLRYMDGCGGGYAWTDYQQPDACFGEPQPYGKQRTDLRAIQMLPGPSGYAAGNYKYHGYDRASIYGYDDGSGNWETTWCSSYFPSIFYAADIVEDSGVAWFGGYYATQFDQPKIAYIYYRDADGYHWGGTPFPLNGKNIYHRPINNLDMSSDTMGWAVGDPEDGRNVSVIYQYPYPNFTLDSSPANRVVLPGGSTTFTVTVNSIGGFSADVSLDVLDPSSLPVGVTVDIIPSTVNAEISAIIDIQTSSSTPLGEYELPFVGFSIFRSGDNDIPVSRVFNLHLTVTEHPLYSVSPSHGPAGTRVTLTGANFGSDPGEGNRSTASNHVILAGQQMPDGSVFSWSDSEIIVLVPDDPALFPNGPEVGEVSVTAGGTTSNTDFTFQLENYLDNISIQTGDSDFTVTVTGTSLGEDPGGILHCTTYEHVSLDGVWIPNANVLSWSNNAITFTLPVGTHAGQITVTSNGFESNPILFTPSTTEDNEVYLPLTIK